MRKLFQMIMITMVAVIASQTARAATIDFEVEKISENRWQYNYSVVNDTMTAGVDIIAILFDYGRYANLKLEACPDGWDGQVLSPINGERGYLGLGVAGNNWGNGLSVGERLAGISVSFDWFGENAPNIQDFIASYWDSDNSNFINNSGYTTGYASPSPAPVPEPHTLVLLGVGMFGLSILNRCLREGKK